MKKLGLLKNKKTNFFLEKFTLNSESDDEIQIIEKSDIVFYVDSIQLLPNGSFDTKKLHDTIESWGYCFENEIPVHGKIFVIHCNLNVGETQRIHEILNPMNVEVVYLPPTSKVDSGHILLGTLNQYVVSDLTKVFIDCGLRNLSITSMSSKSAELSNLLENNFRYLQHTYSKMINEVLDQKEEIGLVSKFLGLDSSEETLDMKLKNDVFNSYIQSNQNPINFPDEIINNLDNHNIFNLNNILDLNQDLSVPLIVNGLTYPHSDNIVDTRKVYAILELLKRGYSVHVLESESFLKDKKIILELSHDFGDRVKFYKKDTNIGGVVVNL
jgi:hypothetical protein